MGLAKSINKSWVDMVQPAFNEKGEPNFLTNGVITDGLYESGELNVGIYTDLPNELYHSLPALSSTGLKTFAQSPRHYYREYKSDIERTRTLQQERTFGTGSLGHELILEPDGFYDRYASELNIHDYKDDTEIAVTLEQIKKYLKSEGIKTSGTKAELVKRAFQHDPNCKVWDVIKEKHAIANKGKAMVDSVVWNDAHRIQQTHLDHPISNQIISGGYAELTMIAKCQETGMWLKIKFDYVRPDGIAADVKTSRSANPSDFARQAKQLHYDLQQVFYCYVASLLGVHIDAFIFLVIEYINADICEPIEIDERDVQSARELFKEKLHELHVAEENDDWKGYNYLNSVNVIRLPNW